MEIIKERGRVRIFKDADIVGAPREEMVVLTAHGGWLEVRKFHADWFRHRDEPDTTPIWVETSHASFDVFEWLTIQRLVQEHLVITTREGESIFQMHVGNGRDPSLEGDELAKVNQQEIAEELIALMQRHAATAGVVAPEEGAT